MELEIKKVQHGYAFRDKETGKFLWDSDPGAGRLVYRYLHNATRKKEQFQRCSPEELKKVGIVLE